MIAALFVSAALLAPHEQALDLLALMASRESLPAGWSLADGELESAKGASILGSGFEWVRRGAVSVELRLLDADATAASLVLGASHLGFCGRSGRPFVEGPLFGGPTRFLEVPAPEAGQAMTVALLRSGADGYEVRWNGETVLEGQGPAGSWGEVALRPQRDRLQVMSWAAEGVQALPEPLGECTDVWRRGEGADTFRIPAVVQAVNGDVLAFCEARNTSSSDTGDIDLVMRRSSDGGRSFSESRVLWDDGPNTCGNPCPVVDRRTGRIHLLLTHNLGSDHESAIIAGHSKGTRTVWVMSSADHGRTWSAPREITSTTKEPNWTWYATGPGAGIQLTRGAHAGRLVVPCDHIEAVTRRYWSHVIHSDDGGQTWQLGGSTPADHVNECEVAELEDGGLLLNMRNYDRNQRQRQQARSTDGGTTWGEQRHVPELVEPICQASLRRLRFAKGERSGVLLFTNPASSSARERLTLRASYDDGRTWPEAWLVDPGAAAYSCLCVLEDGSVLVLYEAGGYGRIVARRLDLEALGVR